MISLDRGAIIPKTGGNKRKKKITQLSRQVGYGEKTGRSYNVLTDLDITGDGNARHKTKMSHHVHDGIILRTPPSTPPHPLIIVLIIRALSLSRSRRAHRLQGLRSGGEWGVAVCLIYSIYNNSYYYYPPSLLFLARVSI